jgi:Domain of unknown function (DUF4349)
MRKLSLIIALPLLAMVTACQDHSARDEAAPKAAEAGVDAGADAATEAKEAADEGVAADAPTGGAVFTKPAAVSPSVAPGVAFQYNYDFRVPAKQIEAVQDEHAAACETLGLSRCQITGLTFTQNENRDPSGRMEFMLDPSIARRFGRDAIASVEKAEGVLATSNVSGENVGAEIASSQVRSAGMEAEVKRIEARLAGKGLANDERVELRNRAEELREMMGGEKDSRRTGEKRLATTPVVFNYSGDMGIGADGSFGGAVAASTSSMTTMLSMLVLLLGVVLPWLLPIAAIVLLIRSPFGAGLRRWWNKSSPLVDEPVRD